MNKAKHSKMGKRLIAAMKEVVDHVEGRTALPMRYVEVPEDVDVRAIRAKLGLSQAEFSRRYAVSPRSLQEWEQGRRRPESAVRAYLTVIDRNPEAVENALLNKP
jgi:putative transcriptional regulator